MPFNQLSTRPILSDGQSHIGEASAKLLVVIVGVVVAALDQALGAVYSVAVFYGLAIATSAFTRSRRFLWVTTATIVGLVIVLPAIGHPPRAAWYPIAVTRAFITFELL